AEAQMDNLIHFFALAVVLVAVLAGIGIRAAGKVWMKTSALAVAALFMPLAYASLVDLLGKPKPARLEWVLDRVAEATVLGAKLSEGEAIFLWLDIEGTAEPRSYVLPWNRRLAEELQRAMRQAEVDGTGVRVRAPFEPSLDDSEPRFYAPPPPPLPPKDHGAAAARTEVAPQERRTGRPRPRPSALRGA
ncbi:MAG: hypothetical protein ACE5LL_04310, partial [Alphaproteobacteria bacterium]